MIPRFLPLGDSALTVEFGNCIDQKLLASVAALDELLSREKEAGRLPGMVEAIPTYRSLTVLFDPELLTSRSLQSQIMLLLNESLDGKTGSGNHWNLPVCYDADYGIDLERVAAMLKLSPAEIIELHSSRTYTVYLIGFLPGFPFMGDVVTELQIPRRQEPRTKVPAGSVAIAGQQTAIYPWESPGGWNILGRCPLPLFDAHRLRPTLLGPGDRIDFQIISPDQYEEFAASSREQSLDFGQFQRSVS
jgi:inhibitor of KinA